MDNQKILMEELNRQLGYAPGALEALSKGAYMTQRTNALASRKRDEARQYASRVPQLRKNLREKGYTSSMSEAPQAKKPSTRYENPNVEDILDEKLPAFDKRYTKDFENFYEFRFDKADMMDIDPITGDSVPHWNNVMKDVMAKNGWTEDEFVDKFTKYNDYRNALSNKKELRTAYEIGKKFPKLGSTITSIINAPEAAFEGIDTAIKGIFGSDVHEKIPTNKHNYKGESNKPIATLSREVTREGAKENYGNFGDFVYDMGQGLVDMGTNYTLSQGNQALMGVVSGAQAAAQNERQALERGVDPDKASKYGLVTGAIAGVLNGLGLDAVLKTTGKTAVGAAIKAAGTEGLENVVEDISDRFVDEVINKENSERNQTALYYMSNGMSEEEAYSKTFLDFLKQELKSFGSGALFGGVLNASKNLPQIKSEVSDAVKYNRKNSSDIQSIVEGNSQEVLARAKAEQQQRMNDLKGKITEPDVISPQEAVPQTRMDTAFPENEEKITSGDVNSPQDSEPISFGDLSPEQQAALQAELDAQYDFSRPVATNDANADSISGVTETAGESAPIESYEGDTSYVAPNQYRDIDGNTYVGKGTKIEERYTGKDPLPVQSKQNSEPFEVSKESFDAATDKYNKAIANGEKGFAKRMRELLYPLFDGRNITSFDCKVDNLSVNGKPYYITVYKNVIDKLIGTKVDPVKLSVMEDLEGMIETSNWVGSGNAVKGKKDVTRYDYFEKPITVNGQPYLITYSVEVRPNVNQYRTHAIIDEIEIQQTSDNTVATPDGAPVTGPSAAEFDSKIPQNDVFVNGEENTTTGDIDVPEELIDNETSDRALNNTGLGPQRARVELTEHASTAAPEESFILEEAVPGGEGYQEDGMSRVMTNSAINAGIINKEMLDNDPELQNIARYERHNNNESVDRARENVVNHGDKLYQEYADGREVTADQDVDECMIMAKNFADQLDGETDQARIDDLTAKRNVLLSRLREAGTRGGQLVQAFAKWNGTADGAMLNGERILQERSKAWQSNNQKKVQSNNRIAKALARMGDDTKPDFSGKPQKSHEEIREGVLKVLSKEYGSIEGLFNENDIEYLTTLAENKDIPIWQITDEIEHRLNYGDWYSLDESIEPNRPINQKLQSALEKVIERPEAGARPEPTLDEIREQVKNTLAREYASEADFTDDDVNYLASLIKNGATVDELTDALNTKLATGTFGISADTEQKVNDLFKYADYVGVNSQEGVNALLAAYKLIANETVGKASGFEKFEAWRYLAMLGNTKTMVRNKVGNSLFNVVTGFSNNLSAAIESGVDLVGKTKFGQKHNINIDRTKALLNPLALIESGIDTAGKAIGNTKIGEKLGITGLKKTKFKDSDLISAARADGKQNMWSEISGENSKYEKNVRDKIKSQKSVFDAKWLQIYEKLTDAGISDTSAVLNKYSTSLAGFLKANGLDASAFDAEPRYKNLKAEANHRVLTNSERAEMQSLKKTIDLLDKARNYAIDQADYSTFHEDNAVASAISNGINKWRSSDSGVLNALGTLAEGVVPFKKTPANIIRSGFEYSPFGAVKSFKDSFQLWFENSGKRKDNLGDTYERRRAFGKGTKTVEKIKASDVIDSWSKTLTGSMMAALGYWLADKGILHSSRDDEKYQDQLEGKQNYAININGKSYTIDWAAPGSISLLIGAEWQKISEENGILSKSWFDNIDSALGTVNALLDPVIETSMLQGIQDSLESAARQFRNDNNTTAGKGLGVAGALIAGAGTNFLTQAIPTAAGQLARTIDPTRRSTDTATSSNFLSEFERVGRKAMNKLPGLSYLNEPYIDAKGQTQKNSPFESDGVLPVLGNFAYQSLSPSYYADIEETDADKMARSVYEGKDEDGKPIMDSKVFAPWKSTVKVGGEKLDPHQMRDYRERSGKFNDEVRTNLAHADWFNELSPSQQKTILSSVDTLTDKVGKAPYDASVNGDDYDAFVNGGVEGVMDYLKLKGVKKQVQERTGMNANSNDFKDIVNDVMEGDMESANAKIEEAEKTIKPFADEASDLGVSAESLKMVNERSGDNWSRVESDLPAIKGLGLDKDSNYLQYAQSVNEDANITPQEFLRLTKQFDADKSNTVNQDELINYFNANKLGNTEVMRYWRMFALGQNGNPTPMIPYVKRDGTWGKKNTNTNK